MAGAGQRPSWSAARGALQSISRQGCSVFSDGSPSVVDRSAISVQNRAEPARHALDGAANLTRGHRLVDLRVNIAEVDSYAVEVGAIETEDTAILAAP